MSNIKTSLTSSDWVASVCHIASRDARVNRVDEEKIRLSVQLLFNLIDQVNACTVYDQRCGGFRLEDVRMPSWAKHFVFPKKVIMIARQGLPDLVDRPKKDAKYEYDETAIAEAAQYLARIQKVTADFVTASQLRGDEKLFSEVNFSINGRVFQKDDETFIPVPFRSELTASCFEKFDNMDEEEVVKRFFAFDFHLFESNNR